MAKGIDPTMIGLLAAGGYGVYAYSQGLWPFAPSAPVVATPVNYVPAKTPTPTPTPPPSSTTATPPTGPAAGTLSVVNGATYQWNGTAWVLMKAAPVPQACQTGYHFQRTGDPTSPCMPDVAPSATFCDSNTPGWSLNSSGQCVQTPAPVTDNRTVSQKMVAAAGISDGLSTDQWCYYFTQVTGNDCPVDPGAIDYTVYNAAGVNLVDGTIGDRTTPISIGQWLQIMQSQAPGAGLSGLGDDSTPGWGVLIAAGLALFLMGGR